MKKAFYYLREYRVSDAGAHPYACVCLVQTDDGKIARGISVCSEKDTFSKRIGRNKAEGYAMKALCSEMASVYKRSIYANDIVSDITKCEHEDFEKYYPQSLLLIENGKAVVSSNGVPLTDFERSLLEN